MAAQKLPTLNPVRGVMRHGRYKQSLARHVAEADSLEAVSSDNRLLGSRLHLALVIVSFLFADFERDERLRSLGAYRYSFSGKGVQYPQGSPAQSHV